MTELDLASMKASAQETINCGPYLGAMATADMDRYVATATATADNVLTLVTELEKARETIAELSEDVGSVQTIGEFYGSDEP